MGSSLLVVVVLVPLALCSPDRPVSSALIDTLGSVYINCVLASLGLVVRQHGSKPQPREPHIFVANHTSVTDYAVASARGGAHAVVAQAHGGVFGWMSRHVLQPLTNSLLFDRSESRDRAIISQRYICGSGARGADACGSGCESMFMRWGRSHCSSFPRGRASTMTTRSSSTRAPLSWTVSSVQLPSSKSRCGWEGIC